MNAKFLFALLLLLTGSAFAANQKPVIAHTFVCNGNPAQASAPCPNGAQPDFLIQGSDGNFYGTAQYSSENPGKGGTIFSLTPAGKFTVLHTFVAGSSKTYPNGSVPVSLTEGPDGNLYGVTQQGGNNLGDPQFYGFGVVFRISKTGTGFQVIHRFCSTPTCNDGEIISGPMMVGSDGNIYGVTSEGGAAAQGAIFRVTPSSGAYEVVYEFPGGTGGEYPLGTTLASDGSFYGITINGGTIFHFDPASGFQSTELSFPRPKGCGGLACFALGQLVLGQNGKLYGLYTIYDIRGVGLFEVETDGSNLKLYPEFNTNPNDENLSGLTLGSDGNLWVAEYDLSPNPGSIIVLSPSDGKAIQTLRPFGGSVGVDPASLIQAKDGTLWGSNYNGGTVSSGHFAGGTVFSLNANLPPR